LDFLAISCILSSFTIFHLSSVHFLLLRQMIQPFTASLRLLLWAIKVQNFGFNGILVDSLWRRVLDDSDDWSMCDDMWNDCLTSWIGKTANNWTFLD